MNSRREILLMLAGVVTSAFTGTQFPNLARSEPRKGKKQRVIIIGAGMSGAKAARDLADAGCEVTVLEARDRIGGRIWTDRSLGAAADLGASWIHESRGNPIDRLARKLNVPLYEWDYENLEYCGANGEGVLEAVWRLENRLEPVGTRVYSQNPNASVRDVINALELENVFSGLSQSEKAMIIQVLIEQATAADIEELAVSGYFEGKSFGGPDLLFPKGYDELVKALLEGIEVNTEEAVSEIDYSKPKVKITTQKGVYEADCVLVTVSLGVLKSGNISFKPALPSKKRLAVEKLGMGVLNKVCFKFPKVFWDKNVNMFVCAHNAKAEWATWMNLANVVGEPVLMAFNGGSVGRGLERFSDEAITRSALSSLKSLYGKSVINPTGVLITRWGSDPYSFGSYSHLPPGADSKMRDDLAQTIDDKVFFSGEATTRDYPATVHGAFLTGKRAASEILKRR